MPRINYDQISDAQLREAENYVRDCIDSLEFKFTGDPLPYCNKKAFKKYGFVPQNVRAYRDRTGGARRKSTRRKSTRRKSIKRKSIKRKSIKRKSTKRKSMKRKSMKRKNTRRRR